jgi:hypothetical protein
VNFEAEVPAMLGWPVWPDQLHALAARLPA